MPMKRAGSLNSDASEVIGSVEVLEAKIALVADDRLNFRDHVGLYLAILEHRLDDQIAILQRGVVGRRRDHRQQLIALGALHAALHDAIAERLVQAGLALVGGFLIAVDQHHLQARRRAHLRDAGAHEAGADHADFFQARRRHVRPAGARPC